MEEHSIISGKRIAKNTVLLYIRMMVVMVLNLFTVRLVLKALGAEDYGIFDVVAGVVTMMQALSTVIGSSTSRYVAFYLGERNISKVNEVFSNGLYIFGFFSLLIIILGETIGLWFINNQLVIPPERLAAANWVFQFAILSFICSIMQSPFFSVVTAHEDINIFAVITTSDCVLKFLFALSIPYIAFDNLIYYASYLFVIPLLCLLAYIIISKKKYDECKTVVKPTKEIFSMMSFSGWMLFASLAGVCMMQVNAIIVNVFFGPIVNAARAIAIQLHNAVNSFSSSFLTAIKSPIIKSFSDKDYLHLDKIFDASNRFIIYSLLIICIPLWLEMDTILKLWLSVTDAETVLFARLMIGYTFVMALNNPISFVMQATGRIKEYHTKVEIPTLLCMPVTYLLFYIGLPAFTTFIVMIFAAFTSHIIRMFCLKKCYNRFSFKHYLLRVILPAIVIGSIGTIISLFVHKIVAASLLRLLLVTATSIALVMPMAFFVGFSSYEKEMITKYVVLIKKRVIKRDE